jgi:phosphoribosylformylglycinamidine synthase II
MFWRVEVVEKKGFFDAIGASVKKDISDLGLGKKVKEVKYVQVYLLDGELDESDIRNICENLLIDPVTQDYRYNGNVSDEKGYKAVEVAYNPGVMDPVEESALKAILDLGVEGIRTVRTAKKYLIKGSLSHNEIRSIAEKILYNKVIQHLVKGKSGIAPEPPPYSFQLNHFNIIKASDKELERISKDGQLFMTLDEMRAVKAYFKKLGRNPTDVELETIAQTWSEHCKHKTFRGLIEYTEENPKSEIRNPKQIQNSKPKKQLINNLLKETVMKVTKELNKPWCVSVFKDNSGIIRFDEKFDVCFKVETHNHPSALEPYGGAGTGIGGVIRDPLGTGMGAKPIINTDVFCFGMPDHPYNKLPKGAIHPKRIMKGVVSGVRDYGNRMGIPTSNGAVLFDKDFVGNPLVFCGNVGILPKNTASKAANKGDLIVVIGGRTGRDGVHGATFSSGELTHESETVSGSCVQIGNPIQEKKVTDTILQARDQGLYTAITDCGAGGLSSAIGEMGEELGAMVHLDKVPLKYKGLRYDEIWISEAQERMVVSVDPKKIGRLKSIFENENVEATVIGEFTGDKRLRLYYENNLVCDMTMKFIHDGVPNIRRKAIWKQPVHKEPLATAKRDLSKDLLALMAMPNVASKEWIIRQYDHEVQGGSVLKPLQGKHEDGPGDACITRPRLDSNKGVVLSCGINIDFGKIDPYWMAASAIDEALRQVTAVGGSIENAAILDNFCWGNCNKPDRLGGLVRASQACYDMAKVYGTPFISGKDSLNNEYAMGHKTIAIPPTLLISCISVMKDVSRAVTMDAKKAGNAVYLAGLTKNEMGGSQYYKMLGFTGNSVPKVDPEYAKELMKKLNKAMEKGLIRSCHDCSDGGMAVALAEMAFAGDLGMDVALAAPIPEDQECLSDSVLLFSESNSRFVVEVEDESKFLKAMSGAPLWKVGNITSGRSFKVRGTDGKLIINTNINELKASWKRPFKDM